MRLHCICLHLIPPFRNPNPLPPPPSPLGSLDAESGVFASCFDLSGSRLITCEADKTIKIWKEDRDSTEDSDPVDIEGWTKQCLALKRH